MAAALEACRSLHARFAGGDGHVSLKGIGTICLALERNFVESELRAILAKLGRPDDGALDLVSLCEVVSYVMKGSPHTHDALTLVDPKGRETVVTLADVAAASLKALYTMHPTFDEQRCWLHTEAPLASQCVAEGEAVTFAGTHVASSFLIRARDWVGRECTSGGESFEVKLRGPVSLHGEVADKGDGTYLATYTAAISGNYTMHVTLNRMPIAGSPFALLVDADQTRPEYCVADGAGLSSAEAGKPTTFTIYKQDRFGNPRTRGVDHFYADVQGPGKWECRVKDERDGSYTVTYTAKVAGTYRLDVGLAPNVGPIAHSPFTIVVRPAPPDPRATTLVAPPPATVLCGRPFTLQIIARDRWGNLCVNAPAPSHGSAAGPSSTSTISGGGGGADEQPTAWIISDGQKNREMATVSMVEPGRFALSLTPTHQGRNMAHVCWAGMSVRGSPFQLKALPAPPHASSYAITYKPRSWPLLSAGVRFKLRVQAHDRFGNVYTAGIPPPKIFLVGTGATMHSPAEVPASAAGGREAASPKSPAPPTPIYRPSFGGGGLGLNLGGGGGSSNSGGGGGSSNLLVGAGSTQSPTRTMMATDLPTSPLSPRGLTTEETLVTRLRSQLLSDFGLGDHGRPLPDEWAKLLTEVEEMHGALGPREARFALESSSSGRANLTLAGKVQRDPSLSISANIRDPEAIAPESMVTADGGLVASSQRHVTCEVTDLAHGVYEVSGIARHAGTYKLCLRLPQRTPSAADPMGGTKTLDSGARVTALSKTVGLSATLVGEDAENVAHVVENEYASAVAIEEAQGTLCHEVTVLSGVMAPSACTLSGQGLSLAHENETAHFELIAIDEFGNANGLGGERFELRAYRLLPAGRRKRTTIEYKISDCGDGRYTVSYVPTLAGRWELSLICIPRKDVVVYGEATSPNSRQSSPTGVRAGGATLETFEEVASAAVATYEERHAGEPTELVGGRSFMVIVRPTLAKHLKPLEAAAAMEAHARLETALACEAHTLDVSHEPRFKRQDGVNAGDGLGWALAGEVVEFVVRLPPRPLRSPERKVVRRGASGSEEVLTANAAGGKGGRVGSWSAAEHLVLEQAKLSVYGTVDRAPGCEEVEAAEFELAACRDNGDGKFYVKYCTSVSGTLNLNVELAGGGHISGSPFAVDVRAGPVVPCLGTAGGRGLHQCEVGVSQYLEIFARDRCGNARKFERENYRVRLVRAPRHMQPTNLVSTAGGGREGEEFEVDFRQGPDGGCRAHYKLLEPGVYLVHVETGGGNSPTGGNAPFEPVVGSPFELSCAAGPIELSCCSLLEVGIGGEPLSRTVSTGGGRLWVQTRDQLANARSTPSSVEMWCELRVPGVASAGSTLVTSDGRDGVVGSINGVVRCACVDLGDGRIEVTYPASAPGGLLDVWIGLVDTDPLVERRRMSSPLGTTEHRLGVLSMEPAIRFGDNSLVSAPGVLRVKPGLLFDIVVISVDDAGRQNLKGGEQLRAQLSSGPAPVALEVYDNDDGSYRVATAVQVSGEYKIGFYLNGLPVAGSPIVLIAPRTNERAPSPRGPGASERAPSPRQGSPASGRPAARQNSPRRAMTREQHSAVGPHARGDSPRQASPRHQVRSRPLVAPPPSSKSGERPPRALPTASALTGAHATMNGYARVLGESN